MPIPRLLCTNEIQALGVCTSLAMYRVPPPAAGLVLTQPRWEAPKEEEEMGQREGYVRGPIKEERPLVEPTEDQCGLTILSKKFDTDEAGRREGLGGARPAWEKPADEIQNFVFTLTSMRIQWWLPPSPPLSSSRLLLSWPL